MQFCTECGEKLPASARFCSSCGFPVEGSGPAPQQPPGASAAAGTGSVAEPFTAAGGPGQPEGPGPDMMPPAAAPQTGPLPSGFAPPPPGYRPPTGPQPGLPHPGPVQPGYQPQPSGYQPQPSEYPPQPGPQPGYPPPGTGQQPVAPPGSGPSSGPGGYPHPGPGQQHPPPGYQQTRPQLAPLDLPLLARDIAAAVLLLISLALPWWSSIAYWAEGTADHSVPATIFTVIALFACAVTYVLPMVFGTRLGSLALLGVKGALVAPLVVMGIIAVVQTLRGEQGAGPAVAVALVGVVLTLQTADQERTAGALWRNTTFALAGVTVLVTLVWFVQTVRDFGGLGALIVLPILTVVLSLLVTGAAVAAALTNRPFSAGIALAGAASLLVLIVSGFIGSSSGTLSQLAIGNNPDFVPQFILVAALAAPALHLQVPALAGRDGWVSATSGFTLVAAVLWAVGFVFNVVSVLVLSGNSGSGEGLALLVWLLALQVLAALGFAITHRMVATNLPQGRMVALVVAGLLVVASVVTWAVADNALVFNVGPLSILVFSLLLVGLVTIPPVMRATPMQTLTAPGTAGGRPGGGTFPGQPYAGQPYPGQQYPGQPYPGQQYPGQPPTGQQYPAHPHTGQQFTGQAYPGQPYGAGLSGQPHPGQPSPSHPMPGQPMPGQPDASEPDAAQPHPGRFGTAPGQSGTAPDQPASGPVPASGPGTASGAAPASGPTSASGPDPARPAAERPNLRKAPGHDEEDGWHPAG